MYKNIFSVLLYVFCIMRICLQKTYKTIPATTVGEMFNSFSLTQSTLDLFKPPLHPNECKGQLMSYYTTLSLRNEYAARKDYIAPSKRTGFLTEPQKNGFYT